MNDDLQSRIEPTKADQGQSPQPGGAGPIPAPLPIDYPKFQFNRWIKLLIVVNAIELLINMIFVLGLIVSGGYFGLLFIGNSTLNNVITFVDLVTGVLNIWAVGHYARHLYRHGRTHTLRYKVALAFMLVSIISLIYTTVNYVEASFNQATYDQTDSLN